MAESKEFHVKATSDHEEIKALLGLALNTFVAKMFFGKRNEA